MGRFTKFAPIFAAPRGDQEGDQAVTHSEVFKLPDNLPPLTPFQPPAQNEQVQPEQAAADAHEIAFPPLTAESQHAAENRSESAAENAAENPANTALDGVIADGAASDQPAAPESTLPVENIFASDQDQPVSELPQDVASDGEGEQADMQLAEASLQDDGAAPDDGAEHGVADSDNNGHEEGAPNSEAPENDGEPENADVAETIGDQEASEQIFADFQDIVGLPLIMVEELSQETDDVGEENDLLQFFL